MSIKYYIMKYDTSCRTRGIGIVNIYSTLFQAAVFIIVTMCRDKVVDYVPKVAKIAFLESIPNLADILPNKLS